MPIEEARVPEKQQQADAARNLIVVPLEVAQLPSVAANKKVYHSEEFLAYTNEHNASFVNPDHQKYQEGE